MAITVDPLTHVINVPRNDLTLVQSVPTEIRQLDINWFRLQLRAIEGSQEGIYLLKTHNHNTEYARIVEILDPYTVTFEDGQYAVNFQGANTNIQDKTNVNQVSIRPNNSAGLISSADIEYASYEGHVLVDQLNGNPGTVHPAGTIRRPVSNLPDAKIIAEFRGLGEIKFIGDGLITTGDAFAGYSFEGQNTARTLIIVDSAAVVTNCEFTDASVTGTLDGGSILSECRIYDLDYVNGILDRSVLDPGIITLGGGVVGHFLSCYSGVPGVGTPIIDMGGSGQGLAMRNYNGGITLRNKTGADAVSIDLNSGQVILENSVIAGQIVVRGVGKLVDINGDDILTGTWNGVTIINETVKGPVSVDVQSIVDGVWDEATAGHQDSGSTGKALTDAGGAGNPWDVPVPANPVSGSYGEYITKKLLTFAKWIGLR
jgi:hypothetical protein